MRIVMEYFHCWHGILQWNKCCRCGYCI